MASVASTLIGAGVSAYSQYKQGKAQKQMANYNAAMAEREANIEAQVSGENAIRQREMNRRQLASLRGKMAASGVSMTGGSSLDVYAQSVSEYETQVLDIFREGQLKQDRLTNQAALSRYEGKQAYSAGKIGAIGSLIGGAGRAASNIYSIRYSGGFKGQS